MSEFSLYTYLLMEQPDLPPMPAPLVYILAGNGVFLWGKRAGLEALIPVSPCIVRGLFPVSPFVHLESGPIPMAHTSEMLAQARAARTAEGLPVEKLFYVWRAHALGWQVYVPPQEQLPTRVRAIIEEVDMEIYQQTLFEVHSHHLMPAYFSRTDNTDERTAFRLLAVLGRIGEQQEAEVRVRVGIYGHFWEIPSDLVLERPLGLFDALERDQEREALAEAALLLQVVREGGEPCGEEDT
jgi:PRTRC genetic system protein A